MNNEERITNLITLGQMLMEALDRQCIQHSYASVGEYSTVIDLWSGAIPTRISAHLLPDNIGQVQILAPMGLFSDRELKRTEAIASHETIPDWAACLLLCDFDLH